MHSLFDGKTPINSYRKTYITLFNRKFILVDHGRNVSFVSERIFIPNVLYYILLMFEYEMYKRKLQYDVESRLIKKFKISNFTLFLNRIHTIKIKYKIYQHNAKYYENIYRNILKFKFTLLNNLNYNKFSIDQEKVFNYVAEDEYAKYTTSDRF